MSTTPSVWATSTQVNTTDNGADFQQSSRTVALAGGGFLVTWMQDVGGLFKVLGRTYDFLGQPVSGEVILDHTPGEGTLLGYDVAALSDGGFVVTYLNQAEAAELGIRAARYTAGGTLIHDIEIDAAPSQTSSPVSVTATAAGGYEVAWTDEGANGTQDVVMRGVDGSGVAGAVHGMVIETGGQSASDIVRLSSGNFAVAFYDMQAGLAANVRINLLGPDGISVGAADILPAGSVNAEGLPTIVALANGGFVVAWDARSDAIGDVYDYSVQLAIYSNDGTLVKAVFNPYAYDGTNNGSQSRPSVAALSDGGFICTWFDDSTTIDLNGVYKGQRFDAAGNAVGIGFTVVGPVDGGNGSITANELADGRVVLTWESVDRDPNPPHNAVDMDVHVQILDPRGDSSDGTSLADKIASRIEGGTVHGLEGNDLLVGFSGADKLFGGAGNDTLSGGAALDVLTGGLGKDFMTGGAQRDIFDFNLKTESKRGALRDVITDFKHKVDDIDLKTIDASSKAGGNQAFHFIGTAGFHHTAGELRYVRVNVANPAGDKTIVQGDTNGDGVADFQIELTGLKTLTSGDFLL